MNKKSIIFLFTMACGLISFEACALSVHLLFTNNIDKNLRPLATMTHIKDGIIYWDEPIQPPKKFIAGQSEIQAVDQFHANLEIYHLNYFELFDDNNNFIAACLDSYLAPTKDAIIHFILNPGNDENPGYQCTWEIYYLHRRDTLSN